MARSPQNARTFALSRDEGVRPLRAISIAEQIAEDLASDILIGRYKVGDRLGEESIAEKFQVSRGPVRSALKILEKKGLAVSYPRRGVFASEISLEQLRDVMEIRFWLLILAARICADRVTPDCVEAICDARNLLYSRTDDRSVEPAVFASNVSALFRVLVIHARNDRLSETLDETLESSAWAVVWQNLEIDFRSTARRQEVFVTLDRMCTAVIEGDGAEAETQARLYLDNSMVMALASWQEAVEKNTASRLQGR
jgi:DNA-binding GntR family transcriptional regulator